MLADEPADQIERAQLLRDLQDSRPAIVFPDATNLPGARIDSGPIRIYDGVRRQQLEDSQWRSLLGSQQSQINAPASQSIPQGQWRSQTLERDRQAQDLSADILQRSRQWTNGRP